MQNTILQKSHTPSGKSPYELSGEGGQVGVDSSSTIDKDAEQMVGTDTRSPWLDTSKTLVTHYL